MKKILLKRTNFEFCTKSNEKFGIKSLLIDIRFSNSTSLNINSFPIKGATQFNLQHKPCICINVKFNCLKSSLNRNSDVHVVPISAQYPVITYTKKKGGGLQKENFR